MNLRQVSRMVLLVLALILPDSALAGLHVSGWPAESETGGGFFVAEANSNFRFVRRGSLELDSPTWAEPAGATEGPGVRPTEGAYSLVWAADSAATLLTVTLASDCLPRWEAYRAVGETVSGGGDVILRTFDPLIVVYDASQVDPILTPHSNKMMLPAPGAVLSGGVGVVLLGWLRRRRSL